jgi:hypothetical protein
MTQLRPVDRWEWLDLIRRARLGRTTKAVAVMLATYANEDGTRVFPGVARLAVVCELGYNTVKASLSALRAGGWLQQMSRAGERGRATEYRLTVRDGEDVPTPAQIELEVERLRAAHPRGNGGRRPAERADVRHSRQPAGRADAETRRPVSRADVTEARRPTARPDEGGRRPVSRTHVGPPHGPPHDHGHEQLTPPAISGELVTDNGTSAREGLADDPDSTMVEGRPQLRLVTDPPLALPPPRPPRPAHPFRRRDPAAEAIAEATARREARRQALAAQPAEETA